MDWCVVEAAVSDAGFEDFDGLRVMLYPANRPVVIAKGKRYTQFQTRHP